MAYDLGEDFVLQVETAVPGTYINVGLVNRASVQTQRNDQSFPVFARATPISVPGARDRTYQVQGYYDPADAGQLRLLVAEAAGTPIKIGWLHDGTNGWTQSVYVTSFSHEPDPEALQPITFTFRAEADAVIKGTGPLF